MGRFWPVIVPGEDAGMVASGMRGEPGAANAWLSSRVVSFARRGAGPVSVAPML